MAISAKHRSKFAAIVTSPNEWKILEWDEKLQTKNPPNPYESFVQRSVIPCALMLLEERTAYLKQLIWFWFE